MAVEDGVDRLSYRPERLVVQRGFRGGWGEPGGEEQLVALPQRELRDVPVQRAAGPKVREEGRAQGVKYRPGALGDEGPELLGDPLWVSQRVVRHPKRPDRSVQRAQFDAEQPPAASRPSVAAWSRVKQ